MKLLIFVSKTTLLQANLFPDIPLPLPHPFFFLFLFGVDSTLERPSAERQSRQCDALGAHPRVGRQSINQNRFLEITSGIRCLPWPWPSGEGGGYHVLPWDSLCNVRPDSVRWRPKKVYTSQFKTTADSTPV